MKTFSITELRNNFDQIIAEFEISPEITLITRYNKPYVYLVPYETYQTVFGESDSKSDI